MVQFIRNKCLRLWMDERGVWKNDLQCYCAAASLREYSFATHLNSQARQSVSTDHVRDCRFLYNCKKQKPGKKGYPRFQQDNRSVEYKSNRISLNLTAGISPSPMAAIGWLADRRKPQAAHRKLPQEADQGAVTHGAPSGRLPRVRSGCTQTARWRHLTGKQIGIDMGLKSF